MDDRHLDHGLKRFNRLLDSNDYQFVFKKAVRVGNHAFLLLARENNRKYARLGLAVSKKCAKKAVERNQIKRLIRESFRLNKNTLPAVDIVVMCKPSAVTLTNRQKRSQIDKQWHYLRNRFNSNIQSS